MLLDSGALYWKARILFELQRFEEAKRALSTLLNEEPEYDAAIALQGNMASAEGRFEEAVELYSRVLSRQSGATELVEGQPSGENYEALAMAFAEEGHWEKAVQVQTEVLDVARSRGRKDLVAFIEHNLLEYSQGRPCCTPWPAPPSLLHQQP